MVLVWPRLQQPGSSPAPGLFQLFFSGGQDGRHIFQGRVEDFWIHVHGEFSWDAVVWGAGRGWRRRQRRLLSVNCVVELILHNFHVGSHRRFSVAVKIPVEERRQGRPVVERCLQTPSSLPALLLPCPLLKLQSLYSLQVSAGSVDSSAVVGPEGACDLAQGPLLLLRLPGHTEALSTCTGEMLSCGLLPFLTFIYYIISLRRHSETHLPTVRRTRSAVTASSLLMVSPASDGTK